MGILEELCKDTVWEEFLLYKLEKKQLTAREKRQIQDFIQGKKYKVITDRIMEADYTFQPPVKKCVNKSGTKKKRTVYSYCDEESMVLKVMAYLLYRYDDKMSPKCYSFRRNTSAHAAIVKMAATKSIDDKYCLKADISNYFNSIPAKHLVEVMRTVIDDDKPLELFLERLLLANAAYENGKLIAENRGAMAGIPISPFFANIYLKSLDNYFEKKEIPYFRYSDDILILCKSESEVEKQKQFLETYMGEMGLKLNPDKVHMSRPGEPIEFLGIAYCQGKLDLSDVTKDKLKAKIKRKANLLYRWRMEKKVDFEKTAKVMIRIFNKKFYDDTDEHAFTWSRWFFPVLNTTDGLKEIDDYLQMYIRYIYSGRHYKGNYRVRYEKIKELGYRSLVNEYYRFRKKEENDGAVVYRSKEG